MSGREALFETTTQQHHIEKPSSSYVIARFDRQSKFFHLHFDVKTICISPSLQRYTKGKTHQEYIFQTLWGTHCQRAKGRYPHTLLSSQHLSPFRRWPITTNRSTFYSDTQQHTTSHTTCRRDSNTSTALPLRCCLPRHYTSWITFTSPFYHLF